MPLYQFVVFHSGTEENRPQRVYVFQTSYHVKSEKVYEPNSLSFIASRIVTAERAMMTSGIIFTHVVVYEVHSTRRFDARTKTHTLLPLGEDFRLQGRNVGGLRIGSGTDLFFGLRYRRNKAQGKKIDLYLPGCVVSDDCISKPYKNLRTPAIVLQMDRPLASQSWRLFRNLLATMPQLQHEEMADRFGRIEKHENITSGLMLGFVTDNQRLRLHQAKRQQKEIFVERLLQLATRAMLRDLREYHKCMNEFSHSWGDGVIPHIAINNYRFIDCSSIWIQLCRIFGYNMGEFATVPNDWYRGDPYIGAEPSPGTVTVKAMGPQIHSCLMELFHCHQKLLRFYGLLPDQVRRSDGAPFWNGVLESNELVRANRIYNDWDNFTATVFNIVDAINVLNRILLVDAPTVPGFAPGGVAHYRFRREKQGFGSVPKEVQIQPFYEVYPMDKDPYLTSDLPINEATVAIPEEEEAATVFPWLNFDPSLREEEEEDLDFTKAIKNALAKFEAVRRWIGKIRVQMPWYKAIPIEKLAPGQDEAQNPFTGTPLDE